MKVIELLKLWNVSCGIALMRNRTGERLHQTSYNNLSVQTITTSIRLYNSHKVLHFQYTDADAKLTVPDFDQFPFTDEDSSVTATRAFAWMIAPCDVQSFFKLVRIVFMGIKRPSLTAFQCVLRI